MEKVNGYTVVTGREGYVDSKELTEKVKKGIFEWLVEVANLDGNAMNDWGNNGNSSSFEVDAKGVALTINVSSSRFGVLIQLDDCPEHDLFMPVDDDCAGTSFETKVADLIYKELVNFSKFGYWLEPDGSLDEIEE